MSYPYKIRIHPRARHIRLRVDPREGVVVTVPKRFDQRRVTALVAESQDWINTVQKKIDQARATVDLAARGPRPTRIELPAIDERWPVHYSVSERQTVGFSANQEALRFRLPEQATDQASIDQRVGEKLRAWLFDRAHKAMLPMVHELAARHGFDHGRVTIRNQRSRWGSCSTNGNLSLNARLLFCSPAACRYVILHELVHTEHPNHSHAFWSRVAQLDPDYRLAMQELR
ncbi:MAG: M48 family metallopeptidase, partial [Wenzhouxiangella sp.]